MNLEITYTKDDDSLIGFSDATEVFEVENIVSLYDCTYDEKYNTYELKNGWYLAPRYNSRDENWEISKGEDYIGSSNKPKLL
jgi:hypothetical protein